FDQNTECACVYASGYCECIDKEYNCSLQAGTHACYTCMGRDMENCDRETVCCPGSCFKLVDEKHALIMKGCTKEDQEDGSMKRRTLDVKLYWVNDEKVTGETFYCKGSDYCNDGSHTMISSMIFITAMILIH
ncbi:unnamed protein product, partial [Anisakis simplex]|uniref:DUF753 domain-containing protein n=1 Tax=Anisakis simplex TaxID=6269 RepID=A0A0M3J0I2_ANISI